MLNFIFQQGFVHLVVNYPWVKAFYILFLNTHFVKKLYNTVNL